MLFTCIPGSIDNRFLDVSQQAISSSAIPFSLGFRSQTQKLRFATGDIPGTFLKPALSKADFLSGFNERFGNSLKKDIYYQAQIGETISLLYAPFYLDEKLMDGILNKAVGNAAVESITPLLDRRQAPNWPLNFVPTLCPQCGWDLTGEKDALALVCDHCQTMWWAPKGRLEQLSAGHATDPSETTVFMPFWRIKADTSGMALNSYADLIRVANLPKVPQPGWDNIPFYFWIPAFKVSPQNFLTFAAKVTSHQPQEKLATGPPKGAIQGVNMPVHEAVESLKLILATFIKPRQRAEEIVKEIAIRARKVLLVYLPFQEGPHEMIHEKMRLGINKNLLAHARNL